MEDLLLPSKVEIIPGKTEREAVLVVEPCFHGYGTTIGNALRRVMLSSLPGAAVTAIKIKGVQHEFSSIPGVKEDTLEVVLNMKALRLRLFGEGPVRLRLYAKGATEVTAADIEGNSDVEIVNPDLHIATLTDKKSEFEMEIIVGKGRGYTTTEERSKEKAELGVIAIDSIFSPVREVGYRVENVRVGRITNFDKLVMDIETDGTMMPSEAVDRSVRILIDHFTLILNRGTVVEPALPELAAEVAPIEAAEAVEVAAPAEVEETEESDEDKKDKKAKAPKKAKKAAKKK
ncbi:MAG: DNA-directed RNA polymerase subunit alpha [Patescibacteria group bacterium]|jgi:DNA-directed RNA polymerase subunit alpha